MRFAILMFTIFAASPAVAELSCTFTEECFQTLECTDADYTVTLEDTGKVLRTIVQDLDVVYIETSDNLTQLVAKGMGSLHMLTIAGNRGLLNVHIGAGPSLVSYYGDCEGAL